MTKSGLALTRADFIIFTERDARLANAEFETRMKPLVDVF